MPGTTVSINLRAVIEAAGSLCVPREPLEEALGLDPGQHPLEEPVPAPAVRRFWALLEELSGDELIGVKVAQRLVQARPGPLYYLLTSSPNLAAGWARLAEHLRLAFDSDDQPVTRALPGRWALGYHRPPLADPLIPQSEACVIATFIGACRAVLGERFTPAQVNFQHPAPPWAPALRRHLGCPVLYEADHTGMEVTEADWLAPFPTADPALLDLVSFTAGKLVAAHPPDRSLAQRLEAFLGERLDRGQAVSIEAAARALGLSARSLQRKLAAEKLSFRDALDSVRRALALRLLGQRGTNVDQIAGQLGYSQPSQFTRAFRRWTGTSPGQWRRNPGSP